MIKEYFLAIILGAVLGLGITGGYFALHQNNAKQKTSELSPTPTISSTPDSNQISTTPSNSENKTSIKITSPEDNSIISTSKTNIKGDVKPNSLVVISTPSKTFNDKANSNGIFNIAIELDSGVNLVKISSIDSDDNQEETQITLTYSTAKI